MGDTRGGEDEVGKLAESGGEYASCAGGENGEDAVTEMVGGSDTNDIVSSNSIVGGALLSFRDKEDISALTEPPLVRLWGGTVFVDAVATLGRLIELSLLPLRNVSPSNRPLSLCDVLTASGTRTSWLWLVFRDFCLPLDSTGVKSEQLRLPWKDDESDDADWMLGLSARLCISSDMARWALWFRS